MFPFPRLGLAYGFSDGGAKGGEAVEDGDAGLELGDLTFEVVGGQALAEGLAAVHLGFGAASAVVAAPSSPDGSTDAL